MKIDAFFENVRLLQAEILQTMKMCATSDSVLEYMLDGDRLRDVITKVTVISRNS